MELEPVGANAVQGRFFVKQDHQGPSGFAHGGVLAAALDEAMALCVGGKAPAYPARFEMELCGRAPVGSFVAVEGRLGRRTEGGQWASARATAEGDEVALASALFVEPESEAPQ